MGNPFSFPVRGIQQNIPGALYAYIHLWPFDCSSHIYTNCGRFYNARVCKAVIDSCFFLLTLSNSCHWQKYCKLIHGCSEWLFGLNIVGFPTMTRFRNQDAKVVPAPSLTAGRCNDAPVQLLNDYICKSVEGYLPQSQSNGNFLSEQEWTMYYRIWKRCMLFV